MKHPAFVCCAVSFLFLGATSVQAQETSDLTDVHFYPPSAVSMMKYIDYPVSHRTGIPEISIPLYTVRSGSLELPVNLSFHLDDFTRVNQLAGAAGAGWSLSCDLQVSRIINGRDDFHASGYLSTGTSYTNIDKNTPEIIPSDQHLFSMWIKNIDEEPDKFYYKLLGSSGAFYIEKELGPTTVPMNGDRIDYANRNGNTDFSIVGSDGTKYSFSSQYVDWVRDFNAMEAPAPTALVLRVPTAAMRSPSRTYLMNPIWFDNWRDRTICTTMPRFQVPALQCLNRWLERPGRSCITE